MRLFLISFWLALGIQLNFGGDITGTVHAEPKAGTENSAATDGPYASRKYKFAQRVDYAAMRNFIVYIDGLAVTNSAPGTNTMEVTTMKVAQHGAVFSPHVLPVMAGTKVEWPNNDDIYHNVFSDSDAKRFDVDLYKGNPPDKFVVFDQPGRVDVFCSIHADMHCVVLVMSNPYFATTDAAGHYTITNVPAGTYKLTAWHERIPTDIQEVIVPTNGVVNANFTLTIKNLPKY